MAWEEVKGLLTALEIPFEESERLWRVTGEGTQFHAHPAFLESLRTTGRLRPLLGAGRDEGARALRTLRIIPDQRFTDAAEARARLGIADAARFAAPDQLVPFLQYFDTVKGADPTVLAEATAFADSSGTHRAQEFAQLHGIYLTAVNGLSRAAATGLGPRPTADNRAALVTAMYAMGRKAAERTKPHRMALGSPADWESHQPVFAKALQGQSPELNFATVDALTGHAFAHLLQRNLRFPQTQSQMDALVGDYLADARRQIGGYATDRITSELGQVGSARLYCFGVATEHAAMVAVTPAGEAWIGTYYAPDRV